MAILDFKTIIAEATAAAWNITLTRYSFAIGFTILIYDSLLTLSDEMRLIWTSHWGVAKYLFYINRFVSFGFMALNAYHVPGFRPPISDDVCPWLVLSSGYGAIVAFSIANWLLLLRVFALYGRKRNIVYPLTILFILSYGTVIALTVLSSMAVIKDIRFSPTFNICVLDEKPATLGFIWVAPITLELVIFFMATTKIFIQAKSTASDRKSPILAVLIRDGLLYFIVIMGLRVLNLIAWIALPTSLIFIGFFLLWGVMTTILSRLFLNLRSINNPAQAAWTEGEPYDSAWTSSAKAANSNIFHGGTIVRHEERVTTVVMNGSKLKGEWEFVGPRMNHPFNPTTSNHNNHNHSHHHTPGHSRHHRRISNIELGDLSPQKDDPPAHFHFPYQNPNQDGNTSPWGKRRIYWEDEATMKGSEAEYNGEKSVTSSHHTYYGKGRAF